MELIRKVMAKLAGTTDNPREFSELLIEYLDHIIDSRPKQTAVTLINDVVPGSRYKIYQGQLAREIKGIIEWPEDEIRKCMTDLNSLLRKVESKQEPSEHEWWIFRHLLLKYGEPDT